MSAADADIEQAFLDDIRAHPADPTPKLVYADWLDEHDQQDLAFAFRWAAKRGQHPSVSLKGRRVYWSTRRRSQNPRCPPCAWQLPSVVLERMRGVRPSRARNAPPECACRDIRDAFARLAVALRKLRDILDY